MLILTNVFYLYFIVSLFLRETLLHVYNYNPNLNSGHFGPMGFLDASEQPPTFGAKFTDIRGFTLNGWTDFGNRGLMGILHEQCLCACKYNPRFNKL